MKRTIVLLICLLVLLVSLVGLLVASWGPRPCPIDVRDETFQNLKTGMNEKEIAAILGGPPGDYRTRTDVFYFSISSGNAYRTLERFDHVTTSVWSTDECEIYVYFDPEGKAVLIDSARGHVSGPPPPPSTRYPFPLRQILHPIVDP
jgi:outer membrane protein assembly factor BamE (lipoprotein component of BamABCDE complex)